MEENRKDEDWKAKIDEIVDSLNETQFPRQDIALNVDISQNEDDNSALSVAQTLGVELMDKKQVDELYLIKYGLGEYVQTSYPISYPSEGLLRPYFLL
jgi:hypothetical protein